MAVYEQSYRRYTGPLTAERWRFLTLPRHAYREVFQSKPFVIFLTLAGLVPLVYAAIIYATHNLAVLATFNIDVKDVLAIDTGFFLNFLEVQSWIAFFVALVLGPGQISADLRNHALPLYFARPFSRFEYVLGKSSVLLILLSLLTWVPGLLLFALQGYFEGWSWVSGHARIAAGLFLGSWVWILVLTLLTLALSAWVRWKPLARGGMLMLVLVMGGWGKALNKVLDTRWGALVSITDLNDTVRSGLFGREAATDLPLWAGWLGLAAICAVCFWGLSRRIRAYEVVR